MSSRLHIALAMTASALTFSENPVVARTQQKPVTAVAWHRYVAEEKDGFRYFPEATKWISNEMPTE